MKRSLALFATVAIAASAAAQERISMIYDVGNKKITTSPLLNAHAFKRVPNANYFITVAPNDAKFRAVEGYYHSSATGGWLGITVDDVEYFPSCIPLKPAIGVKAGMPLGGDTAKNCAPYQWYWDGVLNGRCDGISTYREKNLQWSTKINTGTQDFKRFVIDFRGSKPEQLPIDSPTPYCTTAIKKYREGFEVPNASEPCRNHAGVDANGVPTWVIGLYDSNDPGKTAAILNLVDAQLAPEAYVVDWNEAGGQIPAMQAIVGAHKVYPLVWVTLSGTANGQPCFTPSSLVSWLANNSFAEVVIQSQDDSIPVSNQLVTLLGGNQ